MKRVTQILFPALMLLAVGSLLLGLYTGLVRLGVLAPGNLQTNGMLHGPLMINGFLGTLISLERAAALRQHWTWSAPVLLALSTVLILSGITTIGSFFLLAGTVMLVAVLSYVLRIDPALYHLIMLLGAFCLLIGNVLFVMNYPLFELVFWWVGFPVLTIFGERLELNRIMRPPMRATQVFTGIILLWMMMVALLHLNTPAPWYGLMLLFILPAAWMIRYDVARKTIGSTGWTRFSALCMLTGYFWLIIAGIYASSVGQPVAGLPYDALLHMIFIGFVFSMIFAHAAFILPALTGMEVPYSHYFYLPFALLHGFLLVRVLTDFTGVPELQQIGSYGNLAAILIFMIGVLVQVTRANLVNRASSPA